MFWDGRLERRKVYIEKVIDVANCVVEANRVR